MKSVSSVTDDTAPTSTAPASPGGGRLSPDERRSLDEDGYVVRPRAFSAAEVAEIGDACERLVTRVVANRREHRLTLGSYVFDPDFHQLVIIKWEGESDVVHGLEPFAHLDPELRRWAHDERFLAPMRDVVGHDEPMLFTEKLNLKRAGHGGANPLHQDHPYWRPDNPRADDIATAILFLDDAKVDNGCLHVVPGSHRDGEWAGRTDGDPFLANEIDQGAVGDVDLRPVEVEAGSIVMFGAFLVHASAPNRTDRDRRALLFSYQPPIEPCPTQIELLARLDPSRRDTTT